MNRLVQTCFSRLHVLDPKEEEDKLQRAEEADAEVKMNDLVTPEDGTLPVEGPPPDEEEPPPSAAPRIPYGLPSILELLRVLVNVLDPSDQKHTDSTRLTVLGILNTAFEEAGPVIPDFPSLKALVVDPGCKFLFQLARSDNMSVLHATLRTISTMFDTMRPHLKLQQELFLAFTIDRLAPPPPSAKQLARKGTYSNSPRPGTPAQDSPLLGPPEKDSAPSTPKPIVPPALGQTRGLLLETLGHIARHPSFMVDIYANYDCSVNSENMLERLIDFLTKVGCLLVFAALC